jgi:hypothetical protein
MGKTKTKYSKTFTDQDKEKYALEQSKKQGWWNYYQLLAKYEKELEEKKKFNDEMKGLNSELKLPDFIILLMNNNDKQLKCPICDIEHDIKEKDKYKITVCGHMFCNECLNSWIKENDTCPSCREKIKRKR